MTRRLSDNEVNYIRWQNLSIEFYLSSRLLYFNILYGSAAFCATQAIESLMKATLVYWDKSFIPKNAGHKVSAMVRSIRNKTNSKTFSCPDYFYNDQRYQTVSRYPNAIKGVLIPKSFLYDLDMTMCELIKLVPFQFNSELKHVLSGKDKKALNILRRKNNQMRNLRTLLGVKL